jgi:hypothetical protein
MPKRMHHIGNCSTVGTYESINAMRASARQVTWRTFRRRCPDSVYLFRSLGGISGATHKDIEESCFFSFYKSTFAGRPCYYACWSGYEWIWLEEVWDEC